MQNEKGISNRRWYCIYLVAWARVNEDLLSALHYYSFFFRQGSFLPRMLAYEASCVSLKSTVNDHITCSCSDQIRVLAFIFSVIHACIGT